MLWNSWINPNILHLGVKCRVTGAKIVTTHNSKDGVWWWLYMTDSNLNLAKPIIILVMRHDKSWDAENCLNQSKLTQSWREKWTRARPTLTPHLTQKYVVVTILGPIYQSQHPLTIHYTSNERLEGLRCYETLESIQTYSILVWNVGSWSQNCHHPQLKRWGVVMVIHDRFKSQSCKTNHYTCNETW